MRSWEQNYIDLLRRTLTAGERRDDRTGTGTLSLFGEQIIVDDIDQQFPVVTTKKLFWRGVVAELLWFLRGETNVVWLEDRGVKIWSAWADDEGELGPVYGRQWRSWNGHDQIAELFEGLRDNPTSRRHIVSAWNVDDLDKVKLPWCHVLAQWYVRENTYLDCQLYQRSADLFLGVPFNIASYSLLTSIIADIIGYIPGRFIQTIGDAHIYQNHVEQVKEQLTRKILPAPLVSFTRASALRAVDGVAEPEEFSLIEYNSGPTISAPVAV